MKILFGMPAEDSWGGPASTEPPFVEALRRGAGERVRVVEEIYVYGDKEKPTPALQRVKRVLETARRFRKILRKENFDIIHLNTAFDLKTILRDSFSLYVMRPPKETKIFLKLHGSEAQDFTETNFFVRFLMRYLSRRVDGFGVHTSDELENFEKLGFDPRKFFLVKNVVSAPPENPAGREKNPSERFELLFIARFVPKKGLLETIEACRILKEKNYSFVLRCVGDGETRREAERLTKKYRLEDHVEFTGYVSEEKVSKFLSAGDVLIFPTRFGEGFPNVFFKALAAGMPIVATRFRAAKDFLKDGENYVRCTPEPESIAAGVIRLIEDKNLRKSIGANNRRFGRTLLPEKIAESFLEIYRKILNDSQPGRE